MIQSLLHLLPVAVTILGPGSRLHPHRKDMAVIVAVVGVIRDPHHLPLLGGGMTPHLVAVDVLLHLPVERETCMLWIQDLMGLQGAVFLRPLREGVVVVVLGGRRLLTERGDVRLRIRVVVGRGQGRRHPHPGGNGRGHHPLHLVAVATRFGIGVRRRICVLGETGRGELRRI